MAMGRIIHTYVEMDIESGETLRDEKRYYEGEIAECGGGGGGDVNSVDYEYNARMASISEKQNEWAQEYFNMWKNKGFKQYEIEQIQANRKALPYESKLYTSGLKTATSLLPQQEKLARMQMNAAMEQQPLRAEMESDFLKAAQDGVDVNERVELAQADVTNAWKGLDEARNHEMARMGVSPTSGRYDGVYAEQQAKQAAQVAQARNQARQQAEEENFNRLKAGAGFTIQGKNDQDITALDTILKNIQLIRG